MSYPERGGIKHPVDFQEVLFKAWISDDSTSDVFEDDQAHADGNVQTHYVNISPPWAKAVRITKVHFMMNPTAAETYQLYLYERATAVALTQQMDLIYTSGAGMADSVEYIETGGASAKVPVDAFLHQNYPSTIYFLLDWTGAPGATTGFIELRGIVLDRMDYDPAGGA